eukprot:15086778-Alexandrium_andersonii.AAC.1
MFVAEDRNPRAHNQWQDDGHLTICRLFTLCHKQVSAVGEGGHPCNPSQGARLVLETLQLQGEHIF